MRKYIKPTCIIISMDECIMASTSEEDPVNSMKYNNEYNSSDVSYSKSLIRTVDFDINEDDE